MPMTVVMIFIMLAVTVNYAAYSRYFKGKALTSAVFACAVLPCLLQLLPDTLFGGALVAPLFILRIAYCAVGGFYLLTFYIFCAYSYTVRARADADTYLVLGMALENGEMTDILKARLDAACVLLVSQPSASAVLSGGKGEAELMEGYLTGKGIFQERLKKETSSVSTAENFEFSKALLEGETVIVTSDFHARRALSIAKRAGVNACAYPVRSTAPQRLAGSVREYMGLVLSVLTASRIK